MAEKGIWERILTETWPAKMARSAFDALMLPGDVYAGRVDPMSDEGIGKAADLAGLVMGGAYAAAPAMKNASGMGIRAYHGSPHDFDRFDLSKIGTGEGAQAYGHGLYFADKEDVARSYRDTLSRRNVTGSFDGQPLNEPRDWWATIDKLNEQDWRQGKFLDMYGRVGGDKEWFVSQMRNDYRDQPEMLAALDKFNSRMDASHRPGKMYEVDINAHPDQFLDWDKPLSAHPRSTQEVLARTAWSREGATADDIAQLGLTGEHAYKRMIAERGGSVLPGGGGRPQAGAATEVLREAGIPGIKYLDQGSRAAGDGSRNYVVFDDSLINILRKYGLAATAGPIAALLAGGNSEAATAQ